MENWTIKEHKNGYWGVYLHGDLRLIYETRQGAEHAIRNLRKGWPVP